MFSYIVRRMLLIIPTVFVAISFLFFLFYALPGDPATLIAGGADRNPNPIQIEQINEQYGLERPDHGAVSSTTGRMCCRVTSATPTSGPERQPIIADKAPNSIRLAMWAFAHRDRGRDVVGLYSAIRRYSLTDKLTTVGTAAVSAVPVFVLGLHPAVHVRRLPKHTQLARMDAAANVGNRGTAHR